MVIPKQTWRSYFVHPRCMSSHPQFSPLCNMNITYLTPPDNTCNPGRVADGAVASEPPDADVVVLV